MERFRKHSISAWLLVVPCLVLLAGAFPSAARAQANFASLSGTLSDSSGGVLPGVAVICKNVRTGQTRESVTNEIGIFRFADLPIGQYEITATLQGFQTLVAGGINLITGQTADLKLVMEPGGLETTVEVSGATPVVQTSSSTVQTSMTVRQVQELPLNGRNPLQLVALTAGASITAPGSSVAGQQDNQAITVNGLRSTQNNFRMDGSNYNNRFFGSAPVLPNPDTLEEFTVQSANYSARTAGAGALVELSTRSGSNQLHFSAFEFLRDKSLNANDPFNNAAGREKPPFKLNQFGGTIGGPIVENKTFYFGAYQATRRRSAPGTSSVRSLTANERSGNFSDFTGVIRDPLTGLPFPGNVVPSNRLDPTVQQLLTDMLPLPNSGLNLVSPLQSDTNDDQVTARVDHQFASSNRLTVRYFYDANRFQRTFNAPPGFLADNDFRNQSFLVRDSHIFSSNFLLTLQGSYSKFQRIQEPATPNMKTIQEYGVNAPQSITTDFFPGVRFMAAPLFNLFSGGGLEQTPWTYDFHASAVWSKGRHNLQFGIDTQYDRLYVLDASFTVGTWTYNGSRTGYLPADIMMGLPSSFVQDSGRTLDIAEWKNHFWIQDDWKVNNRLTVNAGLRWEPWTPPTDSLNNLVGFVKGQQSTVAPDAPLGMVYPGDAGIPESLFSNNYGLFAPRIGAAYDLFGNARTVVRGGYGIFYVDPALTIYTRTVSTQPSVLTVSTVNPYSFMDPYNGVPGGNPYPFPRRDPSEFAAFKYVKPVSGGVLEPTGNKGYSQNWNLTLEQQIGKDMSLSVAYVANKGTDILAALELNPAIYGPGATTGNTNSRRTYAGMSAMEIATPYQRSDYNSLQITATKRASQGLTILSTYVYSTLKDNGSQTVEGGGSYPRSSANPDVDYSYGDFDIRHKFNLSVVYDLPNSTSATGLARALLNDWQVNGILVMRSGLPFTVKSGTDRSLTAVGQDNGDLIGDPTRPADADPVRMWFNTAAFDRAAIGTIGTVERNSLRGPNSAAIDMALFKNFPIGSRARFQFRLEAFNVFNRVNYNTPNANINAGANFGRILGAGDPRVLQLGFKLLY
ncbi:MAG: TonB-dependent receptor [Vicinamibacterales bacterium]